MGYTTDPKDPNIGRGVDTERTQQHSKYLVLDDEELSKPPQREVRLSYVHVGAPDRAVQPDDTQRKLGEGCGSVTTMGMTLARTYARDPTFYGATMCVHCQMHRPVGANGEFVWEGTNERVGT